MKTLIAIALLIGLTAKAATSGYLAAVPTTNTMASTARFIIAAPDNRWTWGVTSETAAQALTNTLAFSNRVAILINTLSTNQIALTDLTNLINTASNAVFILSTTASTNYTTSVSNQIYTNLLAQINNASNHLATNSIFVGDTIFNNVSINTNLNVANITVTNFVAFRMATNNPASSLTNFVVNFNQTYTKVFLTNDLNFSHSTNRDEGLWKSAVFKVYAGAANRQVWLTSVWTNLYGGSTTNYFTLPAGKSMIASFASESATEGLVNLVICTNAPGF